MKVENFLLDDSNLDVDIFTSLILSQIESAVRNAFSKDDAYHGPSHAKQVEDFVIAICNELPEVVSASERFLVRTAAILHDIGYAFRQPDWHKDARDHVMAGVQFANSYLGELPVFSSNKRAIQIVCYLIAHHDDTNFSYPSKVFDGKAIKLELGEYENEFHTFIRSLNQNQQKKLDLLLKVLREADARTATGLVGAQRTFNYSASRGIPIAVKGVFVNSICWEESSLTNVRLAAKRAMVDAFTENGRLDALRNYEVVEGYIRDICEKHDLNYAEELFTKLLRDSDNKDSLTDLTINRYFGWEHLEETLRQVPLKGDPTLRPYADARINIVKYTIEQLRPTSHYVLHDQIESHRQVNKCFIDKYSSSVFDLTGIIEYMRDKSDFTYRMAPPIVETYYEPSEQKFLTAIVDGMHRIWLARDMGLKEIWTVEISNIPVHFHLVPLPATWSDLRVVKNVPSTAQKRKYRFPSYEYFPNISNISSVPVTKENYLYFFYRDLSSLGSSGIRTSI